MSSTELTSKVRQIKELQQLIDEATAEMDGLKDSIKAEMTASNVNELTVDVFTVRWKPVQTARFDSTAFKATHAELYQQYTKTTESRRFCVV